MTRRCVYCCPRWTWGLRWRPLRRLARAIWPPHIIGPDSGPPYTDGLCAKAAAAHEAHERAENLRAWRKLWKHWEKYADSMTDRRTWPAAWIHDYQEIRRANGGI